MAEPTVKERLATIEQCIKGIDIKLTADNMLKQRFGALEQCIKSIDLALSTILTNDKLQWEAINLNCKDIAILKTKEEDYYKASNRRLIVYSALIGATVSGVFSMVLRLL